MTGRMSPDDLAAIRERLDRATPGPWVVNRWHVDNCQGDCDNPMCFYGLVVSDRAGLLAQTDTDPGEVAFMEVRPSAEDDAHFLAHARTDVPALLAHIDALQAMLHYAGGTT